MIIREHLISSKLLLFSIKFLLLMLNCPRPISNQPILAANTSAQSQIQLGPNQLQQQILTNQNLTALFDRNSTLIQRSTILCPASASCRKLAKEDGQNNHINSKRSCYCDSKCAQYDDCCADSPFAINLAANLEQLRELRQQWHCYRVNQVFGDILLKASCSPDWLSNSTDPNAQFVKDRCEYIRNKQQRFKNKLLQVNEQYETDPIGMMMPITDLTNGITYANSYCLRCNRLPPIKSASSSSPPVEGKSNDTIAGRAQATKVHSNLPKLIYWSPLLECNYNLDKDDRNSLYDLIATNRGQVLEYSAKRRKWMINLPAQRAPSNSTGNQGELFERVCSITPTIPDSAEQSIRYCNINTVDTCPTFHGNSSDNSNSRARDELERLRNECKFGYQGLVYSATNAKLVYRNLACSSCNRERQLECEPTLGMNSNSRKAFGPASTLSNQNIDPRNQPTSGEDISLDSSIAGLGRSSGSSSVSSGYGGYTAYGAYGASNQQPGAPISGSFSVLMDLYGSSQGDEQVGAVHQCPDAENQVFDPFFLTCRDIVCGLNHQLVEGKCQWAAHDKTENLTHANLVDKFKPPMAYLTAICLIISIASLSMYLALYLLSMFDLRHLVVEMAQAGLRAQMANNPLNKSRFSRESNDSAGANTSCSLNSTQIGSRSQSLSSRGVACLASSLLAAYLLFMLGHSQQQRRLELPSDPILASSLMSSVSCLFLAVGTYYCFLVSFNWMFLLSYDVWRTLRLATCQLRGPALNSKQSTRFLVYTLFAFLSAAMIVALALMIDQFPETCQPVLPPSSDLEKCNNQFANFVHNYRPKFGQKLASCWFTNRRALALFFGLPVTLIMLINLLFFLHSSYMVIRTSSRSSRLNSQQYHTTTPSLKSESICEAAKLNSVASKQTPNFTDHHNQEEDFSNNEQTISRLNQEANYSHQNGLTTNSLTSVSTIQSNILASLNCASSGSSALSSTSSEDMSCCNGDESPPPRCSMEVGRPERNPFEESQKDSEQPKRTNGRKVLESSESSNSLITNKSIQSNQSTLTTSLAIKYDQHLNNLSSMMSSILKDYRLYCRLSTIMGLTWLTGLIASLVDQSDILWYLFVILNTLQGLFIFIAFGCKRSKLVNLEILLNYAKFKLLSLVRKENKARGSEKSTQGGATKKH